MMAIDDLLDRGRDARRRRDEAANELAAVLQALEGLAGVDLLDATQKRELGRLRERPPAKRASRPRRAAARPLNTTDSWKPGGTVEATPVPGVPRAERLTQSARVRDGTGACLPPRLRRDDAMPGDGRAGNQTMVEWSRTGARSPARASSWRDAQARRSRR
jgi:hypothetical protein